MNMAFFDDPRWDAPFFKRLANNDTHGAAGHQGGPLIPKEISQFLPELDIDITSPERPTVDCRMVVDLFVGPTYLGRGATRYQYQTWGGTRTPERRITGGLIPLTREAKAGDFLIFQHGMEEIDQYRLVLVRAGDPWYQDVSTLAKGNRAGTLFEDRLPNSFQETRGEIGEMLGGTQPAFKRVKVVRTRYVREAIRRGVAFPAAVKEAYGRKCCVSGISLVEPTGLVEVQAAHIIPVHEGGPDDVRNGLALTATLHWAFDLGLFEIDPINYTVRVPPSVLVLEENRFLARFDGQVIAPPVDTDLRPHPVALKWHRKNRVERWDKT